MSDHIQPGELQSHFLFQWCFFAEETVRGSPCALFRQILSASFCGLEGQSVGSFLNIAHDIAHEVVLTSSGLHVHTAVKQLFEMRHESGAVLLSGSTSKHLRLDPWKQVGPQHAMKMQSSSGLELIPERPLPNVSYSDLFSMGSVFQQVLMQENLQHMVHVTRNHRLLFAQAFCQEDTFVQRERPLRRRHREKKRMAWRAP